MPKLHGSANSETKRTERRKEEEVYNPQPNSQSKVQKVQKQEYFIKNACYSVAKYYLCKQNNKRSLLGRKQRNQVTRLFPNRYLFSFTNKVTSLFSIRYILIIILSCETNQIAPSLFSKESKTKKESSCEGFLFMALQDGLEPTTP